MKAKTVNEVVSFQRYRDPKTALGMNYGKKPLTNAWKILEFVGSKKEEGVTYTEIQHFIWTVLWEKSEESFWKKDPYWKGMRISRGIYGDLISRNVGLLHQYCHKNKNGKWVLDRMPEPGENIYAK